MLVWLQLSLQALVALTFFCLVLPSTLSMSLITNLQSLEQMEDGLSKNSDVMTSYDKRSHAGADAWRLCPSQMERVDCFYEYLRVYARLRKDAAQADAVSVRNIGKRSESEAGSSKLYPCPDGVNSELCTLVRMDVAMGKLAKALQDDQMSR